MKTKNKSLNKNKFIRKPHNSQDGITRIPRPLGLTLIAANISKNKSTITEEHIHRILQYVLQHNLKIGDTQLSLDNLGAYLNIPKITVMKAFISYTTKLSNATLGRTQDISGVVKFLLFENFLKSSSQINNQIDILTKAQGNEYVPFLTSAVNDILGQGMAANKVLIEMSKLFNPPAQTNLFGIHQHGNIQNNVGSNGPTAIKAIGVNEAIALLEQQGLTNLTFTPEANKGLGEAHNISQMPEVRANFQQGNGDDNYGKRKDNKLHHKTRRVIEEGLDEEEVV